MLLKKQNKTNVVEESICIEQSKENMKKGKEPMCLIDFWMQEIVKKLTALSEFGETTVAPLLNTSNVEWEATSSTFSSMLGTLPLHRSFGP